ncbi:MAG: PEGA domain-containing protein, partial [Polyangiales bacterium]
DFLGCLAQLAGLDVDAALAAGARAEVGRFHVLAAGCALGAGDEALATRYLARAHAADLPRDALAQTPPELQALDEGLPSAPTHTLTLRSRPSGAHVSVDGAARCTTPCELTLSRGHHVFRFDRLGHRARVLALELGADTDEDVALDPAPSDVVAAQLAAELRAGRHPDDPGLAAAAAEAWGARVVVLAWTDRCEAATCPARAALYDRALRRIVSRASAPASSDAVHAVVVEWRGRVEPRPLRRQPAFWALTLTAAGIAALTAWAVARPPERHFAIEAR